MGMIDNPFMKLFCRDFGGTDKPPLVILHGLFGSSRNWQKIGKRLADSFHVLALDLPNHGESSPSKDLSYPTIVKDVLETLKSLGLQKIHLLGHSMGGKVAMHLACHYPNQIESLYIIDVAPKDYPSYQKAIEAMQHLDLQHLKTRREAVEQMESEIPNLETRLFMLTNLTREEGDGFRWQIDLENLQRAEPGIRKTSLAEKDRFEREAFFIVSQEGGYVTLQDYPRIRHHFPKADIKALPNVGHNIHIDAQEKLVEMICRGAQI